LAATIAPAPCSWLRLAFHAPCGPHLICRPSGHSNQPYLSLHHPEATLAKTFHTCSSPATTQTKPHPALVVLGQESVHTMLSITHHWGATIHRSSDAHGSQLWISHCMNEENYRMLYAT
jgi:hypothetical protein